MKKESLKELVTGKTVKFKCYADETLWYVIEGTDFEFPVPISDIEDTDFEFPVPISDTKEAVFLAEDKAILFMKWIKKWLMEKALWTTEGK